MRYVEALQQASSGLTYLPKEGIPLTIGTGKGQIRDRIEDVPLPKDMRSMVSIFGEQKVFLLALTSLVAAIKQNRRVKLLKRAQDKEKGKKTFSHHARASYLQDLAS